MTSSRKQREREREERLARAESAAETVDEQGKQVHRQLSLVARLSDSWRRIHDTNHLAQLFRDEGRIG